MSTSLWSYLHFASMSCWPVLVALLRVLERSCDSKDSRSWQHPMLRIIVMCGHHYPSCLDPPELGFLFPGARCNKDSSDTGCREYVALGEMWL